MINFNLAMIIKLELVLLMKLRLLPPRAKTIEGAAGFFF
jgi:hypothetical protein